MNRISEIFGPTIQGEGPVIGMQTIFIRTWGCDSRCSWCDTKYAIGSESEGSKFHTMTGKQILDKVKSLSPKCKNVTLTGGNPCIQNMDEVIGLLQREGYNIVLETQGTKNPPWVSKCNMIVVSPKPPSAGDAHYKVEVGNSLDEFMKGNPDALKILKIVIFNKQDLGYARVIHLKYPEIPMYLQPGNEKVSGYLEVLRSELLDKLQWLIDETIAMSEMSDVTILPQLHTLVWGNERGK